MVILIFWNFFCEMFRHSIIFVICRCLLYILFGYASIKRMSLNEVNRFVKFLVGVLSHEYVDILLMLLIGV
jgi:hypothetical protein